VARRRVERPVSTFDSDGNASDVTGHGKMVDICAVLG
jgi:hypothetical protein